jgi:hypothetical protein
MKTRKNKDGLNYKIRNSKPKEDLSNNSNFRN